jgi:hypothetical protein
MKIFNSFTVSYVVVETNFGDFKVEKNGYITRWDEELHSYVWVDEGKFNSDELESIRQRGLTQI